MKFRMLRSCTTMILLMFCHLMAVAAIHDQITISGKIDSKDGEPVFATVYLKNSTKGTMTDIDGN